MMVNRCHFEDAFARQFKTRRLRNDRHGFEQEEPANDDAQEFVFRQNGERAQSTTERETAQIAHENLGGIGVEPQKPDTTADDGTAPDAKLGNARYMGDSKV